MYVINDSEQQIVDCAGSNGCNGGNPTAAWNYIVGTGGQDKNSTYPFTGTVNIHYRLIYIPFSFNKMA